MAVSLGAALLGSSLLSGGLGFLGSQLAANTQADASQQAAQAQIASLLLAQQFARENNNAAMAANQTGINAYQGYVPNILQSLSDARSSLSSGQMGATSDLTNNAYNALATAGGYGGAAQGSLNAGYGQALNFQAGGLDNQTQAIRNALTNAQGNLEYGANTAGSQINNALATNNNMLAPYTGAGQNATATLSQLYGMQGPQAQQFAFNNFATSPDYQFAQQEGMRALEGSNASRGLLQSSGHLRSAEQFGQGLASQQYGNYVNRLQNIANTGLSATNTGVAANAAAGNQLAGIQSGYGQNLANAAIGSGGALANIYGQNYGALGNLSAQQGASNAGLLTGMGNTMTGLYGGLGTGLAGIDSSWGQGLAGLYQGQAGAYQNIGNVIAGLNANQAGLLTNQGNQFANLAVQGGNAIASGLTGAGQANAAGIAGSTNALTGSIGNMSNQLLLGSLLSSRNGTGNIFGQPLFGAS